MHPPSVILVRPQMGENIGAAARAMMNFGLNDLRLVAPRDGWPNPKAHEMSAHADGIIEAARVYATLSEALADREFALASTARSREVRLPVVTPTQAAQRLGDYRKSAIIFGPERSGLTSDEVGLAHAVATIPTDEANASLNIAQSVVIFAYEWWQSHGTGHEDAPEELPASMGEVDGLIEHMAMELDRKGFFRVEAKKPSGMRNLRTLLTKAEFSSQEVKTLRGIIKTLAET